MTFYNQGLKTHIVDAVHDTENLQTEFRFKSNTAYLANVRLLDVAVSISAGDNANYNRLGGVLPTIQSIHLFDGNQLLDQILEFPIWSAWSQFNQSNQTSKDMKRNLVKNGLGFTTKREGNLSQITPAYGDHVDQAFVNDKVKTGKGWISLKALLPFLDNSVYLPTGVFKNLRLVIQYNSRAEQIVNLQGNAANYSTKSVEPILIADEILDPDSQRSINGKYKGMQFLAIEHDRVVLPALATRSQEQVKNFTPAGFDNKNIHRLLIVNSATHGEDLHQSPDLFGLGSVANSRQKIQIRVNGQNKFPQNGVTRPMERLAILTDTWGTCNTVLGSNQLNYNTSRRLPSTANNGGNGDGNNEVTGHQWNAQTSLNANLDYFGCLIGDLVQELQIDYSRFRDASNQGEAGNLANNKQHQHHYQQLNLNLFAEAHKVLKVDAGGYTMAYA